MFALCNRQSYSFSLHVSTSFYVERAFPIDSNEERTAASSPFIAPVVSSRCFSNLNSTSFATISTSWRMSSHY